MGLTNYRVDFVMEYSDWINICEITSGTLCIHKLEVVSAPIDPVPKTVRYRNHPRVGPINPQQPSTRRHRSFIGHRLRVGKSKK